MKINILLCDIFEDIMPFEDITYVTMLQSLFDSVRDNIHYQVFEAFARDLPDVTEENAIYLIPGSRADAYSDAPWLKELRQFIQELYDEKAKMIGICFGHQVIAETIGGRVEKAVVGSGLGVREAEFCSPSVAAHFKSGKLQLINYHEDQVVILPPSAKPLATSSFCPNEGYTVGKHIITTQGHPEYDASFMRFILKNHAFDESEITRMKALKTLDKETNGKEMADYMLSFLGY